MTGLRAPGRGVVRALPARTRPSARWPGCSLTRAGHRAEPLLRDALAARQSLPMVVTILADIGDQESRPILQRAHPGPRRGCRGSRPPGPARPRRSDPRARLLTSDRTGTQEGRRCRPPGAPRRRRPELRRLVPGCHDGRARSERGYPERAAARHLPEPLDEPREVARRGRDVVATAPLAMARRAHDAHHVPERQQGRSRVGLEPRPASCVLFRPEEVHPASGVRPVPPPLPERQVRVAADALRLQSFDHPVADRGLERLPQSRHRASICTVRPGNSQQTAGASRPHCANHRWCPSTATRY